jgi:hypothetical protein
MVAKLINHTSNPAAAGEGPRLTEPAGASSFGATKNQSLSRIGKKYKPQLWVD